MEYVAEVTLTLTLTPSSTLLGMYRDRESRYRLFSHLGQSRISDSLGPGQSRTRSDSVSVSLGHDQS